LRPPSYRLQDVPYYDKTQHVVPSTDITAAAEQDQQNGLLASPNSNRGAKCQYYYTNDRSVLLENMAEMLLLCNEVMRRNNLKLKQAAAQQKGGAPAKNAPSKPLSLEYMADRLDVDDPLHAILIRTNDNIGMLQGFITWTTFTNWQASFEWNSLHPRAFEDYADGDYKDNLRDDGTFSAELQNSVRCGDVYNEGIVWPKIAEISLLGALGCGKQLVQLAIENMENTPSSPSNNYEYVALQATDNSINFYEKMGFVRVGAVTEEKKQQKVTASPPVEAPPKSEIISSPVETFSNKKVMTLTQIASQLKLDVWDLIFLNHYLYPGLTPCSKLKKNTELYIPKNIAAKDLSKKKSDMKKVPYMHWQFPDEPNHEASYMMVRRLNRNKSRWSRKLGPIEASLPCPIVRLATVSPSPSDSSPPPVKESKSVEKNGKKRKRGEQLHPDQPIAPKRPMSAYFIFLKEKREELADSLPKNVAEASKIFAEMWRELPAEDKLPYEEKQVKAKSAHKVAVKQYEKDMKEFYKEHPEFAPEPPVARKKEKKEKKPRKMFNKVVKLDPTSTPYGDEYKYYYVLTYLPDLQWCHLCPVITKGKFEESGRDKYVLVNEEEGKEIDVSATLCTVVKAKAMRRTTDADKEEWDIIEDEQ